MLSNVFAILALLALAGALVFAACSGAQRNPATVACDAAATADIVPLVRAAVEARDYVQLAELAVKYGAELYVCAHRELAKQASDAGVLPAKDGAP